MQLEPQVPQCVLFGWWFIPWELWGYWLFHVAILPMELQIPSAPWVLLLDHWRPCAQSNGWLWASTSVFVRHWQSLSGDSYIRLQAWVWWLYMGWIPRWGNLQMVISWVSAPHFLTPSMGILFTLLRRIEVPTLSSSFFLSFMWFVNCILCIPSFWANIHLSVSAYHVYSFIIELSHSEWYPPEAWQFLSNLEIVLPEDPDISPEAQNTRDTIHKPHETQEERRQKCGYFNPS